MFDYRANYEVNLQVQLTFLGSCNNNYATDLFAFCLNCFTLCRLNCLCSFPVWCLRAGCGIRIPIIAFSPALRLGSRKTGLSPPPPPHPQYFNTDRSKAVLLLWFLTVTVLAVLFFGSAIMLVTYFVNLGS